MAICKSESGSPPDSGSAGAIMLDFPDFRTVRKEYLLFKPHDLWKFNVTAHSKTTLNLIFGWDLQNLAFA